MRTRQTVLASILGALVGVATTAESARAERVDPSAAQALLAVQAIDGWLLADGHRDNSIARELVEPSHTTRQPWFYFIPAKGAPTLLVHAGDLAAFAGLAGTKTSYQQPAQMQTALSSLLKGAGVVAMEYAPSSRVPGLNRVSPGTVSLVIKAGVRVVSSAQLVQFSKSLWGPEGRIAHYVAMHHLMHIKDRVLEHVRRELSAGRRLSGADLRAYIDKAYRVRGIRGPSPQVAIGTHTADPDHVSGSGPPYLAAGQLLVLDMSAAVVAGPRPIFARLAWTAFIGREVPERYGKMFASVAGARDRAVSLIESRLASRRPVMGYEADEAARDFMAKAGLAKNFLHRTGHSLDTQLHGDGANLDSLVARDTRTLVKGSGFVIAPGAYVRGQFGVRTAVCVYIGPDGLEVTGPTQQRISLVLVP